MFGGIRSEIQYLKEGKNGSVWKDKVRILMFGRIRSEFQCLDRQGQNSNVQKDKVTIPKFGRIRSEFQHLNA